MKKLLKSLLFTSIVIGTTISCSPEYVDNGVTSTPNNPSNPSNPTTPTNPSGQSIELNFTQGEFIGTLNTNDFQNGAGSASKTNLNGLATYLFLYTNGVNQFNAYVTNKNSSQLAEATSDNSVIIMANGKMYTSTSGSYTISQEQVITTVSGSDVIKCKFTFNGTFEATYFNSFEVLENDVKINGTILF